MSLMSERGADIGVDAKVNVGFKTATDEIGQFGFAGTRRAVAGFDGADG